MSEIATVVVQVPGIPGPPGPAGPTGEVPGSRAINAGAGLTGGGNLTADRTLALTGQALAVHNVTGSGMINRAADGTIATTPTEAVPMGGQRLTGLGNATADADALNRITADTRYDTRYAGIAVANRAYTSSAGRLDLTAVIPFDDTIPQSTEGTQLLSVAITPTSADNRLRIWGMLHFGTNTADQWPIWAVFTSADANAIAAGTHGFSGSTPFLISIPFGPVEIAPATTSSLTISVRAGPRTAGTIGFNGNNSAGRYFGGAAISSLVVEEIVA